MMSEVCSKILQPTHRREKLYSIGEMRYVNLHGHSSTVNLLPYPNVWKFWEKEVEKFYRTNDLLQTKWDLRDLSVRYNV